MRGVFRHGRGSSSDCQERARRGGGEASLIESDSCRRQTAGYPWSATGMGKVFVSACSRVYLVLRFGSRDVLTTNKADPRIFLPEVCFWLNSGLLSFRKNALRKCHLLPCVSGFSEHARGRRRSPGGGKSGRFPADPARSGSANHARPQLAVLRLGCGGSPVGSGTRSLTAVWPDPSFGKEGVQFVQRTYLRRLGRPGSVG